MNFRKISQVYFRAGLKEVTKLLNWLRSSLLDEVAPTFWSAVLGEKLVFDEAYDEVGLAMQVPFWFPLQHR